MENWRAKALKDFPALQDMIEEQSGVIALWIELYNLLETAYEQQPVNDKLIANIYDYAAWCINQPQDPDAGIEDPSSAAAVGLIESIPLNKHVSEDLYRWFSVEAFDGFENLFRYHLSEEEYRKFSEEFRRKRKEFGGDSRF